MEVMADLSVEEERFAVAMSEAVLELPPGMSITL